MTIWASPSYTGPSGVTTERSNVFSLCSVAMRGRSSGGGEHLAAALDGLLDRAAHVEGPFGQLVVLALDDLGEPLDRVLEPDVRALLARERLGDEEGLREEPLDLPR